MKASALLLALSALATPALAAKPGTPAEMLQNRVSQPPTDCLSTFQRDRATYIYDDGSILFEGPGSALYLNRPADCPMLKADRAIESRSPGSLCRGDIIRIFDPQTHTDYGSCPLGQFTPYVRPK